MPPEVRGECPNCKEVYDFEVADANTKRLFSCPTCSKDLTDDAGLPLGWQEFTRQPRNEEPKAVVEIKKKRDFKDPGQATEAGVEATENLAETMKEHDLLSYLSITFNLGWLGALNIAQASRPTERLKTAKELIEFGIELDAWVAKRLPPPDLPKFKTIGIANVQSIPSRANPREPCEDPNCPGSPDLTPEEQDRIVAEVQAESVRKFEEQMAKEARESQDSSRDDPSSPDSSNA